MCRRETRCSATVSTANLSQIPENCVCLSVCLSACLPVYPASSGREQLSFEQLRAPIGIAGFRVALPKKGRIQEAVSTADDETFQRYLTGLGSQYFKAISV